MIPEEPIPRKVPNIIVTGTPGTGKTTFCQLINQSLNFTYLPIGKIVTQNKLYSQWNEKFDVPEFDEDKLIQYLGKTYNIQAGGLLFDFHSPTSFPQEFFDLIILLRCENQTLYKRLQERGYKEEKITQNIECQIFQQIKYDIQQAFVNKQNVLELRNEKKEDMESNLQTAINWLLSYKQKVQGQ